MKPLRTTWCLTSDLEKDKVLRTKRAKRCRKVQFQRSIGLVSPASLPGERCVNLGKTLAYASQKITKDMTVFVALWNLAPQCGTGFGTMIP
jgi:hypothetical protein